MQCPECKASNRPNASFCIECGEPLELNNAPEMSRARSSQPAMEAAIPYRGPFGDPPDRRGEDNLPFPASMIGWIPRPFNPLGWGLEVRITVLLLMLAIGIDLLLQSSARSDASNYQRGLQAEQQKHWHEAATLLKPLALNNYQDAADHYKKVQMQVGEFDHYDNWAQGLKLDGSLIRAALYYKQANQIEPGYDGVDSALTQTLANAGQLLYQKRDGLYLADATGVPIAALPGSDAQSEVLAVASDGQYVAYTGFDINQPPTQSLGMRSLRMLGRPLLPGLPGRIYLGGAAGAPTGQVATRKVYIRNLGNGATELFDDPAGGNSADTSNQQVARGATFVNNNKGLIVDVYRYDDKLSSEVVDLNYFDITANVGLHKIDTTAAFDWAWPNLTDTHLYYTPARGSAAANGSSIVSYDLNTGKSNVIARSDGNIDRLTLGGKLADTASTRVLFYTAAEKHRLRIYSKLPPDASTSSMLIDEADANADSDAHQTFISTSPNSEQAIALMLLGKEEGWLLQPAASKATSLSDKGWDLLMNGNDTLYMEYSPDGGQVLAQGSLTQKSDSKLWFAVVDSSLQVNLRPSWVSSPAFLRWLPDGKHLYTMNNEGFSIIDAVSGQQLVFVARKNTSNNTVETLSLLPDNQTLLYSADDGVYISDVDGQYPIELLPGATVAWLIPANK